MSFYKFVLSVSITNVDRRSISERSNKPIATPDGWRSCSFMENYTKHDTEYSVGSGHQYSTMACVFLVFQAMS